MVYTSYKYIYRCYKSFDLPKGFLKLPEKCLEVTFSDEESIELLLPRPSGLGIYSYALVAHLVYTHNEFIDMCSEIVAKQGANGSEWWGQTNW